MSDLSTEVKQLIIETLDLEDIEAADINDEEALFVDGLGLDSIDALELGVAIKKAYDVKIDGNTDDSKKHFYSVKTLCDFIAATRA
ncbi:MULTISPECIES: phosphopantetheine-binding protein [Pseudoalteromonas]|uniref:Acyl carrier protein n=1 Tax=Pseudoalteromonas arctica A 37-1-2 TaxID=1117313 RepID=A0A290SA77_9GAMM|nr:MULTISPECIES: phosphopantetheine-binding protein [Pseudoalteromonas]ATC88799.1 acyl carrier protein [Pseudoalteromonas arctica A 37-1-2]KAA1153693.1 acyl carrier protein [Pseudoalteromonas sp. FUC4]MBE3675277.1 acyl carrier protein [Pseudoalteromonas distincta KMM 3548]MBH0001487.1 acyl carrier protein [Pseudoalteromonas sp. SWYJZ12]MBH0027703.1 acyl carrier protein [Pseudoalteromonas sp. SWN29]